MSLASEAAAMTPRDPLHLEAVKVSTMSAVLYNKLKEGLILTTPTYGHDLVVVTPDGIFYNIGVVISVEHYGGSGRNFYIRTHTMDRIKKPLIVSLMKNVDSPVSRKGFDYESY